ncbi:MAG: hypothetical protein ACRC0V_12035 [Fusobacteriaceae bacterium]
MSKKLNTALESINRISPDNSEKIMQCFSEVIGVVGKTADTAIDRSSVNYCKLLENNFKTQELYVGLASSSLSVADKVVETLIQTYCEALKSSENLESFLRDMSMNSDESESMRKFFIEKEIKTKKNKTDFMEKITAIGAVTGVIIAGFATSLIKTHINRPWYRK